MKSAYAVRVFDGRRDTFAFANETVWNYQGGKVQWERDNPKTADGVRYTRRCFVLARSAAQFWNFAQFVPEGPRVKQEELAKRIRAVVARPLWRTEGERRVVIPGYADLREASAAEPQTFRESLGGWGQSYFRWGNWRIVLPMGIRNQQNAAGELRRRLAANDPTVLWLVNFPSLTINHAVLAIREDEAQSGRFEVYDPNLPDESLRLTFDEATGRFHYPKTFYFPGGAVGVRLVYHQPWK